MTDTPNQPDTFRWHPVYAGRSADDVRRELAESIRRDQRSHQEAMNNAAREEHGTFTAIRDMEKRWGVYDFDWATTDPDNLAGRITAFEIARDEREEMITWSEWRSIPTHSVQSSGVDAVVKEDWRANLTDEQRQRIASILAGLVMLMIFLIIGGIAWLIFF